MVSAGNGHARTEPQNLGQSPLLDGRFHTNISTEILALLGLLPKGTSGFEWEDCAGAWLRGCSLLKVGFILAGFAVLGHGEWLDAKKPCAALLRAKSVHAEP